MDRKNEIYVLLVLVLLSSVFSIRALVSYYRGNPNSELPGSGYYATTASSTAGPSGEFPPDVRSLISAKREAAMKRARELGTTTFEYSVNIPPPPLGGQ